MYSSLKIFIALLFIVIFTSCTSIVNQSFEISDTYIPYRVGNKYGIINKEGKEIIPPTFDWIDFANVSGTYVGYHTDQNGKQMSNYIFGNKIILKNQIYKYYSLDLNLITATQILPHNYDEQPQRISNLFTLNGRKLFDQDLDGIHVFSDFDKDEYPKDILIKTNKEEKQSYYLFNIRKQKLIPIFENADIQDVDYEFGYKTVTYIITYTVDNMNSKKVFISKKDDSYIISNEKINNPIEKKEPNYKATEKKLNYEAAGATTLEIKKDNQQIPENAIFEIREVDFIRNSYYSSAQPYKISFIENSDLKILGYLFIENDKYGLQINKGNNSLFIPAKYDEIIKSRFGYILRNGNKFGFVSDDFLYSQRKKVYIEPVFEYLPVEIFANYNNIENFHLVMLFDKENNEFVGYGDSTGKLYFSEE